MDLQQVLHMKVGSGKASYANNTHLQRWALKMARTILEEAIQGLCQGTLPKCLMIADLGCSSGSNALIVLSEIIAFTCEICRSSNHQLPEFKVFLNDLPGNDFNTIFRSLPSLPKILKEEEGIDVEVPCFISGTPGSFYERLFPNSFLHFVHSTYSLHWLSQIPKKLVNEDGEPLNKGNIHIAKTSPPEVHKVYKEQFETDFTLFLSLRSKEIVPEGRMVLILMGSIQSGDPYFFWELLGIALKNMALEGLIEEKKLDAFNLPIYIPSAGEVKKLIEDEGSFTTDLVETFTTWFNDPMKRENDVPARAKLSQTASSSIRAVVEPILASEFGQLVMDDLFSRYEEMIFDSAATKAIKTYTLATSMARKS